MFIYEELCLTVHFHSSSPSLILEVACVSQRRTAAAMHSSPYSDGFPPVAPKVSFQAMMVRRPSFLKGWLTKYAKDFHMTAIKSTLGPMGRSVQDVALCMRVFANASVGLSPYSLNLLPMPYRETELPKKLRIGYYTEGASAT